MGAKHDFSINPLSALLRKAFVAATLSLASCSGSTNTCTLQVNWTIASSSDANLCNSNDGWVVVQLTDTSGNPLAQNGPCHMFSVTFNNLYPETYKVNVYMFNASNSAVLGTVPTQLVNVTEGQTTTVTVDIPLTASN